MKYQNRFKGQGLISTTDAHSWITGEISQNEAENEDKSCTSTSSSWCFGNGGDGSSWCLLRATQIGFLFILLYAFGILVKGLIFIPKISLNSSLLLQQSLQDEGLLEYPSIPIVNRNQLQDPPPSTLLDITDFTLLSEPKDDNFCAIDNLLFLIVVHSKPDHFKQRKAIRSTWGGLKEFQDQSSGKKWMTRRVFILGELTKEEQLSDPEIKNQLRAESEAFDDLVIGSFPDRYHNLRYKNLLGLKWAVKRCDEAIFLLKADDDAFIDILGLHKYLWRTFNSLNKQLSSVLAGNVFPDGVPTQREGKWAVSVSEYPWRLYPSYCGGLAYLMTTDVARDLFRVAHLTKQDESRNANSLVPLVPQVWVDDVWVTGLLTHSLNIRPLLMNPRYSYDPEEMTQWLKKKEIFKSAPDFLSSHVPLFTFSHLDPSRQDWQYTIHSLWKHVLTAYNVTISTT